MLNRTRASLHGLVSNLSDLLSIPQATRVIAVSGREKNGKEKEKCAVLLTFTPPLSQTITMYAVNWGRAFGSWVVRALARKKKRQCGSSTVN